VAEHLRSSLERTEALEVLIVVQTTLTAIARNREVTARDRIVRIALNTPRCAVRAP